MNICLYGASSNEIDPQYIDAVLSLGKKIAQRADTMVFGGGANGLMGAAARGMTEGGGKIIGVAPSFFDVDGILYDKCTDFIYTDTMHERKLTMENMADAFIIVPGGAGTFEEFFEALTLKQLGRHNKPMAIFNIGGYFDDMLSLLVNSVEHGFMRKESMGLYKAFDNPDALLDYFDNYDEAQMSVEQLKFCDK